LALLFARIFAGVEEYQPQQAHKAQIRLSHKSVSCVLCLFVALLVAAEGRTKFWRFPFRLIVFCLRFPIARPFIGMRRYRAPGDSAPIPRFPLDSEAEPSSRSSHNPRWNGRLWHYSKRTHGGGSFRPLSTSHGTQGGNFQTNLALG
jgi:hypothetical protein